MFTKSDTILLGRPSDLVESGPLVWWHILLEVSFHYSSGAISLFCAYQRPSLFNKPCKGKIYIICDCIGFETVLTYKIGLT